MANPIASVIIPSYFHEAYIQEAVESVFSQSLKSLELIVIDDGSKDRSLIRLNGFRDVRLRVLSRENQGADQTINDGFALANGRYISILNSDDVFHPRRLETMIDAMEAEKADFAASWLTQIDYRGKLGSVKRGWENDLPSWCAQLSTPEEDSLSPGQIFLYQLLRSNFVSTTSNIVVRKDVVDAIGGMRPLRYAHDWDFALRAALHCRCVMVPQSLVYYRSHATNTLKSHREWMLFEVAWIMAEHSEHVRRALNLIDCESGHQLHYGPGNPVFDRLCDLRNRDKKRFTRLITDDRARRRFIERASEAAV